MAGASERIYYGKDPIEWLIRDEHRNKITSRVQYLHWQYGENNVAKSGLSVEWHDSKVSRLHIQRENRDIYTSFLPQEQFMNISETIEDTAVSMDFNKPDEEGNVAQGSPVIVLHVSSHEYKGATQCILTPEKLDWEKERMGHIFPYIGADSAKKDLLITTSQGMIRLPLSGNIYKELARIEERLD